MQQRAVLDRFQEEYRKPFHTRKKRYAIKSGQGTGKTSLLGWIDSWLTLRRRNGLCVHTAPTSRQCRDAFLADLRVSVANGDPILSDVFKIMHDRVRFFGEDEWSIKTATATDDINLQGFHRDNLTVSVDEGSGVKRGIYEQFQGTVSNQDSCFIVAGNPNLRECYFYDIFYGENRKQWHRWTFSGEQSELVDKNNLLLLAKEYGKDSNVYRIRAKGEFPTGNPDQVIDPDSLELAMKRFSKVEMGHLLPLPAADYPVQFGLDFAWLGDHESVVACRVNRMVRIRCFRNIDSKMLAQEAMNWQAELGVADDRVLFCGDMGGGYGAEGMKFLASRNKNTLGFYNNGNASNASTYENKITEGWFILRKLLLGEDIYIEEDNRLKAQLLSRTYGISDSSQKIFVTPKNKHINSEIGPSPDRAEAVVYSCYGPGTCRMIAYTFDIKKAS